MDRGKYISAFVYIDRKNTSSVFDYTYIHFISGRSMVTYMVPINT